MHQYKGGEGTTKQESHRSASPRPKRRTNPLDNQSLDSSLLILLLLLLLLRFLTREPSTILTINNGRRRSGKKRAATMEWPDCSEKKKVIITTRLRSTHEEIYIRRCIKSRLSLGRAKSFSVAINWRREGVRRESGRRVVNVALRVSAKEGKAGRKSREGEPALSHADIRGYPTGESGVTHFHGLLLAGETGCSLYSSNFFSPIHPRRDIRASVDNGFSLDGHALSSRVPPSSNLRETIPLGWKESGNVPGNTTVRLKYDFTRVELSGVHVREFVEKYVGDLKFNEIDRYSFALKKKFVVGESFSIFPF